VIRVFVAVSNPERRAALLRTVRRDPSMLVVGSEDEADVVCSDAHAESLALPATSGALLTPRELEVLRLVASGMGNRGVAAALGITASTVKHHLAATYAKLGVSTRTEAVREGLRRGLVPL